VVRFRRSHDESTERRAEPRWARRLIAVLLTACTAVALADVVLLSRAFGVPKSGRDTRNLSQVKANLLSARRTPDMVAGAAGDQVVSARVQELFGNERMGTATASSCTVVRQDGRTLMARNANVPVIPASTMKLIVASTVLTELDPATQFITEVRARTGPTAGVLQGDLYFIGGGDPLLATSPYLSTFSRQPQIATPLETLADDIVAAGVMTITGSIIGHDRRYDDLRSVPTWKSSYLTQGEVGPISALSVNDSFVVSDRAAAKAKAVPAVTDGSTTKKKIVRPVWKAATDPGAQAAAVLGDLLVERGVTISGEPRSSLATESLPPLLVAQIASPPLRDIVGQMLSESDNNTAESLVKELAFNTSGLGSTVGGTAEMKASLERRGYPTGQLTLVDGSGLDRGNRVTCAVLVGAVEESIEFIRQLLPVSGTSGTLSGRMKSDEIKGKVRAKTGTLNGVSALAGEVDVGGGRTVDFAMVLNDLPPGVLGVATGDELAIALSRYPQLAPKTVENAAGRTPVSPTAAVNELEPYPYARGARPEQPLPVVDTQVVELPSVEPPSVVPPSTRFDTAPDETEQ
jgi:serine-type D-Ala-D-Ala carboxypeptidase/endopeptidase (penicillin-binding protein 4)